MRLRGPAVLALAAAIAAASTAGPARASQESAVMATVHQFVDGFNKGDMKSAAAACASPASIVDDFPPHEWQGSTACADWASAYEAEAKKSGITGGIVTLGKPWHVDVDRKPGVRGRSHDVHVQASRKARERDRRGLHAGVAKASSGWRITGWAWSRTLKGCPQAKTNVSRAFGYRQELSRVLSLFDNFSVAFSYLSPMVGIYSLYTLGLGTGGPRYIWTIPVVVGCMMLVALVFGELASEYPLSGALYQYGKFSVGPRYGWFIGWIYGFALLATVASVDSGAVGYVTSLSNVWFKNASRSREPPRRSSRSRARSSCFRRF